MAGYELPLLIGYAGLISGCFVLSQTFQLASLNGKAFVFFFRSLGFFLTLQTIGYLNAIADANTAPASVLAGIEVTYTVAIIVFILLFFIMIVDFIVNVLMVLKDWKSQGRVRL